jgi:hypothetical protein
MIPKNEYAPYYAQYIESVEKNGKTIIDNLELSQNVFNKTFDNLSVDKQNYAYAEGKWTVKELIQHIIDTERVFCYRALCFARKDTTSLPGFDEDLFVKNADINTRDFENLITEMKVVRAGTLLLYKSFSEEALLRMGIGSGNKMSVRALGYLFSGHQLHHLNIVKERYL